MNIDHKDIFTKGEYVYVVDRKTKSKSGDWVMYKNLRPERTDGNQIDLVIVLTNDPALTGVTQFEVEDAKDRLINLLYSQMIDLSMMSKIELGDDVIKELRKLRLEVSAAKAKQWDDEDMMKAMGKARLLSEDKAGEDCPMFTDQEILNSLRPKIKTFEVECWDKVQGYTSDNEPDKFKFNSQGKAKVKITYEK